MRAAERGFLLLSSHLGDPQRPVLTQAQLRTLASRVRAAARRPDRELEEGDLVALGYDRTMARRITQLLRNEDQLDWYLRKAGRAGCMPLTRISGRYPARLQSVLAPDAPGCLWAKGELSLLDKPAIALVGSRDLREENAAFAREAGRQAALQGYVLVSGNARGADKTAQDACLAAGGQVISVVADRLEDHKGKENVLWLSEDGFDLPFSNLRALSRNRLIHTLGRITLVAQSDLGKGGTWDGTTKNLRHGWSPVFCCEDGSEAAAELICLGARGIGLEELTNMNALKKEIHTLYE